VYVKTIIVRYYVDNAYLIPDLKKALFEVFLERLRIELDMLSKRKQRTNKIRGFMDPIVHLINLKALL